MALTRQKLMMLMDDYMPYQRPPRTPYDGTSMNVGLFDNPSNVEGPATGHMVPDKAQEDIDKHFGPSRTPRRSTGRDKFKGAIRYEASNGIDYTINVTRDDKYEYDGYIFDTRGDAEGWIERGITGR